MDSEVRALPEWAFERPSQRPVGQQPGQIYEYLQGDVNRIVPGYDPLVFERYPSWKVNDNEIAEVHVAKWDTSLRPNS